MHAESAPDLLADGNVAQRIETPLRVGWEAVRKGVFEEKRALLVRYFHAMLSRVDPLDLVDRQEEGNVKDGPEPPFPPLLWSRARLARHYPHPMFHDTTRMALKARRSLGAPPTSPVVRPPVRSATKP
jgi:hypothetical protein